MNTSKHIVKILALLACLSGCQRYYDSQGEGEQIQFTAATYSLQTKADVVVDFPTSSNIGAFAWKSAAADAWASSPALTPFMTNVKAVYDGTSGKWVPDGSYKWPSSGRLHFLCYSPYKATSPFSWDRSAGLKVASYTIPEGAGEDLCYSDITIDQQRDRENGDPAPILMRHALCKVSFNVEAADAPDGLSVVEATVSDVKVTLNNILNSGSFSAGNATADGGTFTGAAWSPQTGSTTYTYTSSANDFILMPQTLTTGGSQDQSFTIRYQAKVTYKTVADPEVNNTLVFVKEETHTLSCAACTAWGVNQHITYNISVNLFDGDITFAPLHTDWEDNTATIKIGYEDPLI